MNRQLQISTIILASCWAFMSARAEHATGEALLQQIGMAYGLLGSAIQANADVQMNEKTQDTNLAIAKLESNTAQDTNEKNAEVARINTEASIRIAAIQQQGVTERALIVSQAQERALQINNRSRDLDREMEFYFAKRRADAADRQTAETYAFIQKQTNIEYMQSDLQIPSRSLAPTSLELLRNPASVNTSNVTPR